jgi:hypothetical protein
VTIARGLISRIDQPRQVVARTEEEWTKLWRTHDPIRPQPGIDFAGAMVVAVFSGSKPSPGYAIDIVGARTEGSNLVIEYRESKPAEGTMTAQMITAPFHVVIVPRHEGNVVFRQVEGAGR